jgi:pyridoxamine 5'-phosphate oxidase
MSTTSDQGEAAHSLPSAIDRIDRVFSDRRVSYDVGGLEDADLAASPLQQFRRWYDDAVSAQVDEPNAMTLATVDPAGMPTARTVLLKHADRQGFVFFTNRGSRKGTELAANPVAAIVLSWLPLHRQVCVRGRVAQVSAAVTAEYFRSRPWGSRIGAWASHQSRPVGSRAELERRWAELGERWPDHGHPDDVPVPPHWGGYVVRPFEVEFWQGRPSRMHDRLVFLSVPPARPPARDDAEQPGQDGVELPARDGAELPALDDAELPALDDAARWRVERREP